MKLIECHVNFGKIIDIEPKLEAIYPRIKESFIKTYNEITPFTVATSLYLVITCVEDFSFTSIEILV